MGWVNPRVGLGWVELNKLDPRTTLNQHYPLEKIWNLALLTRTPDSIRLGDKFPAGEYVQELSSHISNGNSSNAVLVRLIVYNDIVKLMIS